MALGPKFEPGASTIKANRTFTDREDFIAAFDAALEGLDPDAYRVLVYYGVGGIGKTALRKHLGERLDERDTEARWASVDFEPAAWIAWYRDVDDAFKQAAQWRILIPMQEELAAIVEQEFGAEHEQTAYALHNLADLFREQARYSETEPLYQRSLAIKEQALGEDHPSVAATLNNLAELYRNQGRYAGPLRRGRAALSTLTGDQRRRLRPGSSRCRTVAEQSGGLVRESGSLRRGRASLSA